ncbi:MAG: GNAT family N-acetyltransferase [Roseburia sp.]|nr:GNAT family N-acetyltransferase [Roseburia sp.]
MDVYVDENRSEDRFLLEKDKLSYVVLFTVMGGKVKKIITDHKRIIIAHTAPVFPTWIWAPDDATEDELELIYQTIKKEFAPIENYRFNTKYEIAEYLMKRFSEDGAKLHIMINIATYDCPTPKAPKKQVDGHLVVLSEDELELAAHMVREASIAIGDRIFSEEESVQAAKDQIEKKSIFIWRDADGKAVSFCGKTEDEHYVKITQVYTVPEFRGKNYAGQMIYEICSKVVANGQMPMLYADADYVASNRCYQNIGFELKGRLVTIGV